MLPDLLNLTLRPFGMAITHDYRLVLKGAVDEVRKNCSYAAWLPITGLEIVGYQAPVNPSCAFLSRLTRLEYLRLFAGQLTDLTAVQFLTRLRHLSITHVTPRQSIDVDLGEFAALERANLSWFSGAGSIFRSKSIRALNLSDSPLVDCEPVSEMGQHLRSLSLMQGNLKTGHGLENLVKLQWLALAGMKHLVELDTLSNHPNLRFLWLEDCDQIKTLRFLEGAKQLETLRLLNCGPIGEVEILQTLPRLKHVFVHSSKSVPYNDFEFLRRIPTLETVHWSGLHGSDEKYWRARNRKYDVLRNDLNF